MIPPISTATLAASKYRRLRSKGMRRKRSSILVTLRHQIRRRLLLRQVLIPTMTYPFNSPGRGHINPSLNFATMTIHQYIERKYFRLNTTATIRNGILYHWVNNRWMPNKEFERIFPLPNKVGKQMTNLDSRKNSLL